MIVTFFVCIFVCILSVNSDDFKLELIPPSQYEKFAACTLWCPIRGTWYYQQLGFYCCNHKEKDGNCPKYEVPCEAPRYELECLHDFNCPSGFKCCSHNCFKNKICRPIRFDEHNYSSSIRTTTSTVRNLNTLSSKTTRPPSSPSVLTSKHGLKPQVYVNPNEKSKYFSTTVGSTNRFVNKTSMHSLTTSPARGFDLVTTASTPNFSTVGYFNHLATPTSGFKTTSNVVEVTKLTTIAPVESSPTNSIKDEISTPIRVIFPIPSYASITLTPSAATHSTLDVSLSRPTTQSTNSSSYNNTKIETILIDEIEIPTSTRDEFDYDDDFSGSGEELSSISKNKSKQIKGGNYKPSNLLLEEDPYGYYFMDDEDYEHL